jgi:hypothetical protein
MAGLYFSILGNAARVVVEKEYTGGPVQEGQE